MWIKARTRGERRRGRRIAPGWGMRRELAALRARESGCAAHVQSRSLGREEEEEKEEGRRRGRLCAERSCGAGAELGPQVPRGKQPRQ